MLEKLTDMLPDAVTQYIPEAIDHLDIGPESLRKASTWKKYLDILPSILVTLAIAAVLLWLGHLLIRRISSFKAQRLHDPEAIKRVNTVSSVLGYAYSVFIYLSTALLVFDALGIAVAPLLGAAGIFGIAVGFGAQSLVKDYFNGLFLLIENQLRRGDIVEVGGKSGVVEDITLRYVCLRDYEGIVHFVPNSIITTVTNMSRGFGFAVIDVGIAYKEDIDTCVALMREVGAEMRQDPEFRLCILEDIEIAGVEQWADSSVVLRCRFKVLPHDRWNVRRAFLRRLKLAFDRAGIEIPYPHLTIYTPEKLPAGETPDRQPPAA